MSKHLILHVDGGARGNPGPAAAGVVLHDNHGTALLEAGYLLGAQTNNQAEYNALLLGLQAANRWNPTKLTVYTDSELMARQINGEYKVRSAELKPLHEDVHRQLLMVDSWKVCHVKREANRRADELVNKALDLDEDVVDVQLNDATPRLTQRREPTTRPPSQVVVEVVKAGHRPPCSKGCAVGNRYTIDQLLPVGLSVDVAAEVVEAVRIIRARVAQNETEDLDHSVVCGNCGALLKLAPWD